MSTSGYILAIDQGTTGTTALAVDHSGKVIGQAYREITQVYPQPGWVEHDPLELFDSCEATVAELLAGAGIHPADVRAIGITNQRETTIVWERATGRPVFNAIVWQCRRTASMCDELIARGLEHTVRARTGLPIDAYFSATKIRWILDAIPDGQRRAEAGELAFGTVDSWLLWNLTGGEVHATDSSNASSTMLFDVDKLSWDDELLTMLDLPAALLPAVTAVQPGVRPRGERRAGRPRHTRRQHGGRPAGGPVRPGLLRAGHGQEHLRHRVVPGV